MEYKCFIIDDEEMIAQTTSEYFNMFDVSTAYALSFEEGLAFFEENSASLLLLDINLGSHSGFELCKKLRESVQIPILFISARTSDDDILTALNIGGDDYITKPYSLNILLAKVKAILRRCEIVQNGLTEEPDQTQAERVVLDMDCRRAIVEGKPVLLKEMEFKLLGYLMENRGRVITKEELFENVWEDSFVGDGTLSVHIRHLRSKIERDPDNPEYIKTHWGVGYRFEGKATKP